MVFYFCVSNTITALTQLLWHSAAVRRAFAIGTPRPAPPAAQRSAGFMESFMSAYRSAVEQPGAAPQEQQKSLRKALRKASSS